MEEKKYVNKDYSFVERAEALVSEMTLYEKASQMVHNAPAIPRLNVPSYNWWNEGLHGVARAGTATVFPQAIGLAATFDSTLVGEIANIIAIEGRAKYYASKESGDRDIYKGLTYWSPNINIFRDPRWGRGQETYGEDPYLTALLGNAFVKALQGDTKYLKLAACAKHFAVHSGPEDLRHEFNAQVSEKDLWETYLPAFASLVTDAKVEAVMGAYNRVNGEPCCGSKQLLVDILRGRWGFEGHVVSDCWAIKDFHVNHHVTKTAVESVALALRNGCDLNCGNMYLVMLLALQEGLITEQDINTSVVRLMTTRFKLGLFDEDDVQIHWYPYTKVACKEHTQVALQAARDSFVLLQNRNNILPLHKNVLKTIGVIGPNADSREALVGNYNGTPPRYVTILDGIYDEIGDGATRILYSEGCHLWKQKTTDLSIGRDRIAEAVAVAKQSDVVVLCLGMDWRIEGEEGDEGNEFAAGDKRDLDFPKVQMELLDAVAQVGTPIILLSATGSAICFTEISTKVAAIVQIWYPGGEGGLAVAEMLFGKFSPSGKLPVTIYRTLEELPAFEDYSMKNRTYRFMENPAFYPFGFGLSYTSFVYEAVSCCSHSLGADDEVVLTVKVRNTGKYAAKEIVQCYWKRADTNGNLCGVQHIQLGVGCAADVSFVICVRDLHTVNDKGQREQVFGDLKVCVGTGIPDDRSFELTQTAPVVFDVHVEA